MSRGTDCGNKSYFSFNFYRKLKQESANNRVLPDLSLADIITIVENLTLDKVNNFAPKQPYSSKKTGRVHF